MDNAVCASSGAVQIDGLLLRRARLGRHWPNGMDKVLAVPVRVAMHISHSPRRMHRRPQLQRRRVLGRHKRARPQMHRISTLDVTQAKVATSRLGRPKPRKGQHQHYSS